MSYSQQDPDPVERCIDSAAYRVVGWNAGRLRLIEIAVTLVMVLTDRSVMAQTPPLPNVVVILTDDQGWGDLSLHGNQNLATPHLDSLARDGARAEYFYVCSVCAPTRAEFLTGRYHARTGVTGVSTGSERLNLDETTLAEIFQSAGYHTGAFGKWHNGTQPPYHPNDRGFDEFYGFTSGHWGHYFSPPLDRNGQDVIGTGYLPDDLTNQAMAFISRHADEPFFCYLPLNTPHSPMMVPDRWYEKFSEVQLVSRHRDPEREDIMMTRAALAMCENIDWNVGRLLGHLDHLGLRNDTLVIFFADNGPNSFRFNGGLKGKKGSLDEGGLRSPLLARWPDVIPAGTVVNEICGAVDLLPTLIELTGIRHQTHQALDGVSIASALRGNSAPAFDRVLVSTRGDRVSVRNPRYRLDDRGRLFDIALDPGQTRNVADEHPVVTAELDQKGQDYLREVQSSIRASQDRPFTVGYARRSRLPARDGVAHGGIQRSSKAPNHSFFEDWIDQNASITWTIEVAEAGPYQPTLLHTCAAGDEGAVLRLAVENESGSLDFVTTSVTEPFDPPLWDKSKERVAHSHYFVKDFRPLKFDSLRLPAGRCVLRLSADKLAGREVIDVHSVDLIQLPNSRPD